MPVYPFAFPSPGNRQYRTAVVQIAGDHYMVLDDDLRPVDKRPAMTGSLMKTKIHFKFSNIRRIVRVKADEVGRLDRVIILFKNSIKIPGLHKVSSSQEDPTENQSGNKTPYIMLFYTFEFIGLTDEEREIVEGKKREREEKEEREEAEREAKKAKNLAGRPGRKARAKALALMKTPDAGVGTITQDKRIKINTVSKMVGDMIKGFLAASAHAYEREEDRAQLSHINMTNNDEQFIQIVDGSVAQQAGDPLRMYMSEEDDAFVVSSRAVIDFLGLILVEDIDFVLLVDPREQNKVVEEEKVEQEDEEIDLTSDEGEDLDEAEQVYALFIRARPNVVWKRYVFPEILGLDQLRKMLVGAKIPFAGVVAGPDEIGTVDLEYLCRNKPQDFDVNDDNKIVGSGLDGLQPLAEDFATAEENEFESDDDMIYHLTDSESDEDDDVTVDKGEKVKQSMTRISELQTDLKKAELDLEDIKDPNEDALAKKKVRDIQAEMDKLLYKVSRLESKQEDEKEKKKLEKKELDKLIRIAGNISIACDKDEVMDAFTALPKSKQTRKKLQQVLEEVEIWKVVMKAFNKSAAKAKEEEEEYDDEDEEPSLSMSQSDDDE